MRCEKEFFIYMIIIIHMMKYTTQSKKKSKFRIWASLKQQTYTRVTKIIIKQTHNIVFNKIILTNNLKKIKPKIIRDRTIHEQTNKHQFIYTTIKSRRFWSLRSRQTLNDFHKFSATVILILNPVKLNLVNLVCFTCLSKAS